MRTKEEMKKEIKTLPYLTPFPFEWTIEKYPEQVNKWLDFMKSKENELTNVRYTYSQHSFRGPKHIRDMWIRSYYLFFKDVEGPVRTFRMDDFAPMDQPVSAIDEGRDPSKVMTFEGPTQPQSRFNPDNKELKGEMKILSKGSVIYDSTDINGKEIISLSFSSGLLKGHWTLEQEEKGSDMFTFSSESQLSSGNGRFVYQKHCIGTECHDDIRYQRDGSSKIDEFNLYGDITKDNVKAIKKECTDESWMNITKPDTVKMVGKLETKVSPIDSGRIEIIEDNVDFSSYKLYGKKLRGLFISKKTDEGWIFGKTKIATLDRSNLVIEEKNSKDNPLNYLSLPSIKERKVPEEVEEESYSKILGKLDKIVDKVSIDKDLEMEVKKKKLQALDKLIGGLQ